MYNIYQCVYEVCLCDGIHAFATTNTVILRTPDGLSHADRTQRQRNKHYMGIPTISMHTPLPTDIYPGEYDLDGSEVHLYFTNDVSDTELIENERIPNN